MFKQTLTLLGVTFAVAVGAPLASAADISGTRGNDRMLGTNSSDVIFGLSGNDVIKSLGGNDIVFGGPGRDALLGGADDDHLHGGHHSDMLLGLQGDDLLFAGRGTDVVYAGHGEDKVWGGRGNDVLYALARDGKVDTIYCGPGYDIARIRDEDVAHDCEDVVVLPLDSASFAEEEAFETSTADETADGETDLEAGWDVSESEDV